MLNKCDSCRHEKVLVFDNPCRDCVTIDFVDGVKFSNWKPKEPKIPTDREILLKNSVPGSDIKPGKPSPYLVGAKKSKWRKVSVDGMPSDDGEYDILYREEGNLLKDECKFANGEWWYYGIPEVEYYRRQVLPEG